MELILKNKRLMLALLGLTTLFFINALRFLTVDFSFDSFFPRDAEFDYFEEFKKVFGDDDNLIYLALKNEGSVFDQDFLIQVDSIFMKAASLEHVDSVISPTRLQQAFRTPLGVKLRPVFQLGDPAYFEKSRRILEDEPLMRNTFLSKDEQMISGLIVMDPGILDLPARDELCSKLEELAAGSGHEFVLSGIPFIRTKYVEKIKSELLLFISLSFLLVILMLLALYRSFWGLMIPLIGTLGALIWCFGFMSATGKPIDLLVELLPTIIFVVAISDMVHLITKYVQEVQEGANQQVAMKKTLSEIGTAIFLTSLTTAIGFGSLFISKLPPLREFGLYSAAAVLFAYAIAIVLVPVALLSVPVERIKKSKGIGYSRFWEQVLLSMYQATRKKPKAILFLFGGILVFSFTGMSLISFNTFLLDDVGPNDPIRLNLDKFEQSFFGVRPFEMAIESKNAGQVTQLTVLKDIEKMENYLASRSPFSPFLSPSAILKQANKLYHFNSPRQFKLPDSQEKVDELIGFALSAGDGRVFERFMNKERTVARVTARMPDIGTSEFDALKIDLREFYHQNCHTDLFDYHLTGSAMLAELNVVYLRESLFSGLLLAFFLIGIVMGLLFRSWKMLFIALIPNLIPMLFTAGIMGFLGISLKASSSIVFVISFGIAVDDTIHFLSRLKLELQAGKSIDRAIRNTIMGTGKALILTSLILMSGFILLLSSDFGGTFLVGLFVTLTLVMALLSDLLLLPVLVNFVFKDKVPTEKEWVPDP